MQLPSIIKKRSLTLILFMAMATLCTLTIFSSCAKDYESIPLGQQSTLDLTFDVHDSAGTNAISYLTELYNDAIISGHNRVGGDYLGAATDDAVSSFSGLSDVEKIATGAYTSTAVNSDNNWDRSYATIRATTLFIVYIDRVPIIELLPDGRSAKDAYKAEARFLRAWTYFNLIKRYGGVPIIKDKIYQLTDDIQLPRESFSDCIQYIKAELDTAILHLRRTADINSANYGRITKGAAMSLKAKVLLYAASPLFNGQNIEAGNPLTGYTSFDKNRWKLAADAAKAVIDLGIYHLAPNLQDIFTTQAAPIGANPETIFWRQNGSNTSVEKSNSPVGYTSAGGNGRTSPTQNLVDAFPMISGLAITDDQSGYDPASPYINRDPRLTATIFYNGASWVNREVQTFDGGLDRPGGTIQQTKTSYYLRKFMGAFESVQGGLYANTIHDWVFLRYAGILLDYAEAENEFQGPDLEIYQVLYDLRKRAGIEPGSEHNFGIPMGMTQAQMRTVLRQERRIEMAFEEQRYWDIRRWKVAKEVYSQPLDGMDIQQTGSGQLFFNRTEVRQPNTHGNFPAMYLYPIPYSEVVKNSNMKQNPGWK